MDSPEVFGSPFFSLDTSMPAQAPYAPNQQGPAQNQLQVPRQAFMPFTQQAYSQSYAHPQSRQQASYPSSPSWQIHSRQHQHALPQYGNHYTFGGVRHHPFALAQSLHAKATSETKARLDKKHVEILEQEFQKNQKPSSIIKRELAEQMGHEIARINNWFQNRRAKEKSNRRTAEYAAREANQQRDSSEGVSSGPRSPEHQNDDAPEDRPAVDNMQRPIMSSATIGEVEFEDDTSSEPQDPEDGDFLGARNIAPHDVDDAAQSNSDTNNHRPTVVISHDEPDQDNTREPFRTPDSNLSQGFDYRSLDDFSGVPQAAAANFDYLDESEMPTAWFHPLPQAPSDYFGSDATPLAMLNAGAPLVMGGQFAQDDAIKAQQLASPVSMSSTSQTPPPAKDMLARFALKSPRPVNIAARRNHQRPAALGLSISRKTSYCQGPKTGGIDLPRHRPNDMAPMRRTASATALRLPRVSEGLRSPGNNFQGRRSPSYHSSTSPVSQGRADTPATNNSEEHYHGLAYGNFNAPLTSTFESSINTPPVTPGLPVGYSSFGNPFEQAWAQAASEQSMATPSLCSHGGSEMDFPGTTHIPNYIASQPTTPGFPRPDAFGPGFRFGGHGGVGVGVGMSNNGPEYTFPDSSYVESSPQEHALSSKTFQFAQNVTPQDFSGEN